MNFIWATLGLIASLATDPVGPSVPLPAEPTDALTTGERLFHRGVAAYDTHDYQTALEWFRKAYKMDPEPAILFNMALTYDMLGDCAKAEQSIEAFLAAVQPADPLAQRARAKRAEFEACKQEIAGDALARTAVVPSLTAPAPNAMPSSPRPVPSRVSDSTIVSTDRFPPAPLATTCVASAGGAVAFALADLALVLAAHSLSVRVDAATVWTDDIQAADERRRAFGTAATIASAAVGASVAASVASCWLYWRRGRRISHADAP